MIEVFSGEKEENQEIRLFFNKLDTRLREMYEIGNTQRKRKKFFLKEISSLMHIGHFLDDSSSTSSSSGSEPKSCSCSCLCKKSFLTIFPSGEEYIHFYFHGLDCFTNNKIKLRFIYYSPNEESHILLQKKITMKTSNLDNLEPSVLTDIFGIISSVSNSIDLLTTTMESLAMTSSSRKTLSDLRELINRVPKTWDLTKSHDIVESTQILDNIKTNLSLVNVMLARDIKYSYSLPGSKQIDNLYRQFSEAFSDEDKVLGGSY